MMNRNFWENLLSLVGIHALNYITPLLTLPFLARVLGPTYWGELAFAEAYANYITLLIEYGFTLSASREIAQVRDDAAARSRLMAGVIGAQGLLALFAFGLTIALSYGSQSFAAYRPLLLVAFLLAVLRAITPFWYFLGLERVQMLGAITMASNLAAAVGILILTHSPADFWKPLVLRAGAAFVSAAVAFAMVYRDTPYTAPIFRNAWFSLRQGWTLFVFKGSVSLYTTGNVVVFGLLVPPDVIAIFAGAEKIANAAGSAVYPLMQAFYPRISYLVGRDRQDATRTARISLLMTVGTGLSLGLILFTAAPILVRVLLGPSLHQAVPVLRLLSVLPPIIAISNVLGMQWMLPLRLDKQFNWIILAGGVLNIVLALSLVPHFGQMGMASSVVIAQATVAISILSLLRRCRLDPWSTQEKREPVPIGTLAG